MGMPIKSTSYSMAASIIFTTPDRRMIVGKTGTGITGVLSFNVNEVHENVFTG